MLPPKRGSSLLFHSCIYIPHVYQMEQRNLFVKWAFHLAYLTHWECHLFVRWKENFQLLSGQPHPLGSSNCPSPQLVKKKFLVNLSCHSCIYMKGFCHMTKTILFIDCYIKFEIVPNCQHAV